MINVLEWNTATEQYIKNIASIRTLSSTNIDLTQTHEENYEKLKNDFMQIREISLENRKLLDEFYFPVVNSAELLDDEMVESMWHFVDQMVDGTDMTNLDLVILIPVIEMLVNDAEQKGNVANQVKFLYEAYIIYYAVCNIYTREKATNQIRATFYDKAVKTAEKLRSFLDKDIYASLDMPSRVKVSVAGRYTGGIFIIKEYNPDRCALAIESIERAKDFLSDPFYRKLTNDYDWTLHWIRLAESTGSLLESANVIGATKKQCETLDWYACKMDEIVTEETGNWIKLSTARTRSARVHFYAGKLTWDEYKDILWSYYSLRDKESYELDDVYDNLSIPVEYLAESQKHELTESEYDRFNTIYESSIRYMARLQNEECLSVALEYYADLLKNFIEYPGGMSFYDMCMYSMASMHLPTYVHSNMVGSISLCFARHLLEKKPEIFIGALGCTDIEAVKKKHDEILDYVFKSGVIHDAGKLFMMDTVFVYGRKLLDTEFEVLKCHPEAGANNLLKYHSTDKYAPIALLHHKRIDNQRDYPANRILQDEENYNIAAIVACADCLDAATDIVGRSYGSGITLEKYIEEIRADRGTRYLAEVVDLFEDPKVYEDVKYILENKRKQIYYQSYDILFKNFKEF